MTHDGMKTWTDAELKTTAIERGTAWSFTDDGGPDQALFQRLLKTLEVGGFVARTFALKHHEWLGRCVIACDTVGGGSHIGKCCSRCRIACEHDPRGKKAPQPPPPPPNETTTKGDPPNAPPRPAFADLEEMKACDEFVLGHGALLANALSKTWISLGRPKISVRGVSWIWPWCSLRSWKPNSWANLHWGWRRQRLSKFSEWPLSEQRQFLRDWPHIVRAVNKCIKKKTKESWAGIDAAVQQMDRKTLLAEFVKAPKK